MSARAITATERQAIAALVIAKGHLNEARIAADTLLHQLLRADGSGLVINKPDDLADVPPLDSPHLLEDLVKFGVHGFYDGFEFSDLRIQVRDGFLRVTHGSAPGKSGVDQVGPSGVSQRGRRLSTKPGKTAKAKPERRAS